MISRTMWRRAEELAGQGTAFATATVVRVERPTSVEAGDVALVLADGTIEGFVGGVCTEHSLRAHALEAIERAEPVMLRILPFADQGEAADASGVVTVQNPCLSGGAVELFIEPVLPARRVLVVGDTPIARALRSLGGALDYEMVDADGAEARPGDLALVVASHGRDEVEWLRRGLDAGLPYLGLVASATRGDGVVGELRGEGTTDEEIARIEVPAGLDIGARTPAEVALSILARIVAVGRSGAAAASRTVAVGTAMGTSAAAADASAVDPICGMTVAVAPGTPSLDHDGETVYFCCDGCKGAFRAQHQHASATE